MNAVTAETLGLIGRQLDQGIFPVMNDGGLVAPSELAVPSPLGVEHRDEQFGRSSSSSAGARAGALAWPSPWTAPWAGSFGESRPAGAPAPVIDAGLRERYAAQLDSVSVAYPGVMIWHQGDGLWLVTSSALLPGSDRRAVMLSAVPYYFATPRSWAFWQGILRDDVWIGPRHTNFFDGSICAFEPSDGTWQIGGDLVTLLDIYSLWALRHLHLEYFGWWPGPQSVRYPLERLLELKENEHCGCDAGTARYGQCCRPADLMHHRVGGTVSFILRQRKPPRDVLAASRGRAEPPPVQSVIYD